MEDVGVMVNHNALARQFTVSDNFYVEPEASGVGIAGWSAQPTI